MRLPQIAPRWAVVSPSLLSLARFMIGLMILEYGLMKVFSFPASLSHGEPLPPLIYLSGVIELVAGVLLTVGLFTRSTSFILSGEMAFVYFLFFFHRSPWPAQNGGDLAITWCFVLLYLSATGGGPWGLDALFRSWGTTAVPAPQSDDATL